MTQSIILGGGCFWCIEAVYTQVRGVITAVSGYAGGEALNPTYELVSSGASGFAEVVKVVFDTIDIDLATILEIFWAIHNPTTPNRQGADVGTQYRSVIFYTAEQEAEVKKSLLKAKEIWGDTISTQILPAPPFYTAESYHQEYFTKILRWRIAR